MSLSASQSIGVVDAIDAHPELLDNFESIEIENISADGRKDDNDCEPRLVVSSVCRLGGNYEENILSILPILTPPHWEGSGHSSSRRSCNRRSSSEPRMMTTSSDSYASPADGFGRTVSMTDSKDEQIIPVVIRDDTLPVINEGNQRAHPGENLLNISATACPVQTTPETTHPTRIKKSLRKYLHWKSQEKTNKKKQPRVKCDACHLETTSYVMALEKRYHIHCFKCAGCHDFIDPNGKFMMGQLQGTGETCPFHVQCHAALFGAKCHVCSDSLPTNEFGQVLGVRHPFFQNEIMCSRHNNENTRRCTGCHRFEPAVGSGFANLGDGDRCACYSCCRTVVVDNEEANPLWQNVLRFFQETLELPVWGEMREIPILIVGQDTLNEQSAQNSHHGSKQQTRGLCLSEFTRGTRINLRPRMIFDKPSGSFRGVSDQGEVSTSRDTDMTYFQIPDVSESNPNSYVTAILCLMGLPSDLTASILAHEATHAWFKLHPNFSVDKPIPLQVEEGCCQLVAHLLLNDGLPPTSTESEEGEHSDKKLRQYFKYSIESDTDEIYGEGFRKASRIYAEIGIEMLLSHVALYGSFPEL